MTRFIAVGSAKGGVGKTTFTVNLGIALHSFGSKVIIVDGDLITPNLGLQLGVPVLPLSFQDALEGRKDVKDTIYTHASGLRIIPSSIALEKSKNPGFDRIESILIGLEGMADVVLLDTHNSFSNSKQVFKACDELIVLTTPDLPAVTDALKTIKLVEEVGCEVKGVIINRLRQDKYELSPANVEEVLEKPIIGVVPEDDNIRKALAIKHPVVYTHPDSDSSIALKKIASNIIGGKYETNIEKPKTMFSYFH